MSNLDFTSINLNHHPTRSNFKNLTGQQVNAWLVIAYVGLRDCRQSMWLCRCKCGMFNILAAATLNGNNTHNCKKCQYYKMGQQYSTHGATNTGEFRSYMGAKLRCQSRTNKYYPRYGGRGIKFHFQSFEEFFAHIGKRPTPKHSLDRIDNSGHYEVGNVRWATHSQQQRNKTNTLYLTVGNITCSLAEWGDVTGVHSDTIGSRIKSGWCAICAIHILPRTKRCPHKSTIPKIGR